MGFRRDEGYSGYMFDDLGSVKVVVSVTEKPRSRVVSAEIVGLAQW